MATTGPSGTDLLARGSGQPLDERLQQVSDRATYLARVSRELSGAMHTDRAVDLVLDMLTGPVVEWTQMTLLDRHSYDCRARHADGTTTVSRLPPQAVPPGSSLGRVLGTSVTDLLMVPDGDNTDSLALRSAVPAAELRSQLTSIRPTDLLTIALTARGTTYGALTIARRGGDGFDATAVTFLEDFAQRVAVALDTSRALTDSRRIATAMAVDLNPPSLPDLPGVAFASYYRVAFEQEALGGDFYDVHGDPDDWTVVVGDVCGKGVEAAVFTGKVRQTIRTAATVDRDPAAVLALTNRVMAIDTSRASGAFVTAVCARGRRVGDRIRLQVATAGHPGPLVVRLDGSVEEVEVTGKVLGVFDDPSYAAVEVDLLPGETCLFFTDGVAEAPGRRSRFGEERVVEVLAATGACDVTAQVETLAMAVSAHVQDRLHDDIAILGVQAT